MDSQDLVLRFMGIDLLSQVAEKVGGAIENAAKKMEANGMKMSATFAKVGVVATTVGVGLLGLAGGMAAVGMHAVKVAADFQTQMELIVTQAGATTRELEFVRQKVLDLAPAVGIGPTELAKALFHVESLGVRGAAAMDMLKVAAQGAQVGHADLEATVNALGGIMATHIKGVNGAADAMGQLNAIVGAGNMRMEDLVGAIGTGIVPAAQTFGLSLSQVGGALATLTDLGMGAEESATRLRMTFALMGAPTGAATKQLAGIHLKALDLAMAMRGPGGLVAAVQLLHDHLAKAFNLNTAKGQAEAADVLARAFGGGRSSAAIMGLIQNLDRFKAKSDQVAAGSGQFGNAWAATQDTLNFKMAQLRASVDTLWIRLGNALIPIVQKFVLAIMPLVNRLSDWIGKHQDLIAKWAPLIIGITAALGLISIMVGLVSFLISGVLALANVLRVWAAVQWLVNAALSGNPIGLVIIGIAALIAIIVLLVTHWKQVVQWLQNAVNWVRQAYTQHQLLFNIILIGLGPLGLFIKVIAIIIDHFKQIVQWVGNAVGKVKDFIGTAAAVGKVVGGVTGLKIPGFAEGGYVPMNTLAFLHAGEYVLPKFTVDAVRSGHGVSSTSSTTTNRNMGGVTINVYGAQDPKATAEAVRQELIHQFGY